MPGTQWVKVEMPLGGLDALTDPVHVLPGKLLELENGRFDKPGGISKRPGYIVRTRNYLDNSVANSFSDGQRLHQRDDGEQLMIGDRELRAWSPGLSKWVARGSVSDAVVTRDRVLVDPVASLTKPDFCQNGAVQVISWDSGNSFRYFVRDTSGNLLVKGPIATSLGRLISVGNFIFAIQAPAGALSYAGIDATSTLASGLTFPNFVAFPGGATTNLAALMTACTVQNSGTRFVVAYTANAGPNHIKVELWEAGATPTTVPTLIWGPVDMGETADQALEVYADATTGVVWVVWGLAGTGVRIATINYTSAVPTAALTVDGMGGVGEAAARVAVRQHTGTNVAVVVWETQKQAAGGGVPPPSQFLPKLRWRTYSSTPASLGTQQTQEDLSMLGLPYKPSGSNDDKVYLPVYHPGDGYGHGFIIAISEETTELALPPSWRATFAREICAGLLALADNSWAIARVPNTFAGGLTAIVPVLMREKLEYAKDNDDSIIRAHAGVSLVVIRHSLSQKNAVPWGSGMFIGAGRPSWYDGTTVGEHGFAWPPSVDRDASGPANSDLTDVAGGIWGVGPPADGFAVQVCWFHQDANRQLVWSEPSITMVRSVAGVNKELRLQLMNTLMTDRAAAAWWTTGSTLPRVMPFRTLTTLPPAIGEVLFRAAPGPAGFTIPTTIVSPPAGSQLIDFGGGAGEADADVANYEVIYTQGGILPNTGTPPAEVCHVHGNRLWLAFGEDQHELYFSQPFVEYEQPRFNGLLRLRMDEPIYALGSLDDRLIAFGVNSMFSVSGSGPPAAGGLDLGFQIERIATEHGTITHRSVVETPLGLFFVTAHSTSPEIKLLDRSLAVQSIGDAVRAKLIDFPVCVTGTHIPTQNQVRFLFMNTDGDPVLFVYDYRMGEWSQDVLNLPSTTYKDAYNFSPFGYAILGGDGKVFDEASTTATSTDDGSVYSLRMSTPWIKLDTLQGWQRVRSVTLLGTKPTSQNSLKFEVFYDYESSVAQTVNFTAAQITALPYTRLQVKVRLARQKCQAIRLRVSDFTDGELPDGPGAGLRFSSLVFEAGIKKGTAKLPQEAKK